MIQTDLAPIVLFVYNRPDHTARTLESLRQNNLAAQSELFVFCDGPKDNSSLEKIAELHKIIDNISGFKNVVVEKSSVNKGLANSIIAGVSKIVNEYGKIIVVEDDLVTSPHFLQFMNDGLNFYEKEEQVISIHGYVYPVKAELPATFFLRGADCWGWATWKRGWNLFNANGSELLAQLQERGLENEFDLDGCYPYTHMLQGQIKGENNSWAIRWHASAFLANKLTLYPGKSLVQNIGFDNSGSHCDATGQFDQNLFEQEISINKISVAENKFARQDIKKFFMKKKKIGFIKKMVKRQQFNPGLLGVFINPFYFARKGLYKNIKLFANKITGNVLDVGCGNKPYEELFHCNRYVGLEYDNEANRESKKADFFYDGKTFPFADAEFDSLICNEVLEHIFNPSEFLAEINRVLKRGGYAIMTVPFVWDEHEQPFDYARYSSFGLKHLLQQNGFEIVEFRKSTNDIAVIFQLINVYIYKAIAGSARVNRARRVPINLLTAIFNIVGLALNLVLPKNNDLYLDNVVLVRKK